ncbi:PDZ domain-containing protein [bacterium]|nr:PDZ domain-containing protein [bacterium]
MQISPRAWRPAAAIGVLLLSMAIFAVGCATSSAELTRVERAQLENAVDHVKPSLVRIQVVEPAYYEGREFKSVAFGSGTIITPDGYVMTNHHVAGNAVRLLCTMPNREEVPAILIGTDPATDIAIIKLQPDTPQTFPVARFGNSDELEVGDRVLALGSPLGLSQSVTLGVISNAEMIIPSIFANSAFRLDGENVGELVRWIGHDAAIYGGNSGGPLVNMNGEIIGVNELSWGLAGAIPGNLAKKVAFELIENEYVRRAYIGLNFQPQLKDAPIREGVLVAGVQSDSPAEKAGFQSGDIVLSIAGQPVEARFLEDMPTLNNVIANLPIGKAVPVVILRDGNEMTIDLTAIEREPALPPTEEFRAWGLTGRDLSLWTQLSLARDSRQGVIVTSTRPGGPVAKAEPEIRGGDVIVRVGDREINSADDLISWTEENVGDSEETVPTLVEYERKGENFLTVVDVGIDELDDPGVEVRKAWLPIETQVLTKDLAEKLDLKGKKGVRVTRVYGDIPEDFPLEVGDVITQLDGTVIEASQAHDTEVFRTMIREYRIGTEAEFTVLRDGEKMNVTWKLGPSPETVREMARFRDLDFEFIVRETTYYDRQDPQNGDADVNILVDSVTRGGWASLAGLHVGDVLLAIDAHKVTTLKDVEEQMDRVHETEPNSVVFEIRRGTQQAFIEIEPSWDRTAGSSK